MKKFNKRNILLIFSIGMLILNIIFINTFAYLFDRIIYIIFYTHVSTAWASYISFSTSLILDITYLIKKDPKWSIIAKNSIIVGVVFTGFALFSGSLFFNATSGNYSGIYWTWNDPRQTMTLVLFISYITYLIFGSSIKEKDRKHKITSILGIFLFPTVPLSYLSAVFYNSLHPMITLNPTESGFIYSHPMKLLMLFFNLIAITILFIYLVMEFVDLDKKKEELNELIQRKIEED